MYADAVYEYIMYIAFPAVFCVLCFCVFLKYMTHFMVGKDIRLGRRQSDLSWLHVATVATVDIDISETESVTDSQTHSHL